MSDILCELNSLITRELVLSSATATSAALSSEITSMLELDSIIDLGDYEAITSSGPYAPKYPIWR